jgi:hypothetical protein
MNVRRLSAIMLDAKQAMNEFGVITAHLEAEYERRLPGE